MYICDFSRSVGAGSATCGNARVVRSVMRRMVPPLPAASRPSKTTMTLAPVATTHCWRATSSPWRTRISASYAFFFIFGRAATAASNSSMPDGGTGTGESRVSDFFELLCFFDFLLIDPHLPAAATRRLSERRASSHHSSPCRPDEPVPKVPAPVVIAPLVC